MLERNRSYRAGTRDGAELLGDPSAARRLRLSHYARGPVLPRVIRRLLLEVPFGAAVLARCSRLEWLVRLADDALYWAGVRTALGHNSDLWRRVQAGGVPVLLYHRTPARTDRSDPKYALRLDRFKRQMRLLRALGYTAISADDLVAMHRAGQLPRARQAVVTFDDGYADNFDALCFAAKLGIRPMVFVAAGDMGHDAGWRRAEIGPVPLLSWAQLRALLAMGVQVGSHSAHHPDLRSCCAPELDAEINGSAQTIAREVGERPRYFAYPHGMRNAGIQADVAEAGYEAAFGTQRGLSTMHDDVFELRRIQVYGDERLPLFLVRLWFGDNPLDYLPWGRLA